MWKTTEYTEHTEESRFFSVFSVDSVVYHSSEFVTGLAAISRGGGETRKLLLETT